MELTIKMIKSYTWLYDQIYGIFINESIPAIKIVDINGIKYEEYKTNCLYIHEVIIHDIIRKNLPVVDRHRRFTEAEIRLFARGAKFTVEQTKHNAGDKYIDDIGLEQEYKYDCYTTTITSIQLTDEMMNQIYDDLLK